MVREDDSEIKRQIWSHSGGMEIKEAPRAELWLWGKLVSTRQDPRDGIPLVLSLGLRDGLAHTPGFLVCQHIENTCMFQGWLHRHQTPETLETSP